MMMILFIQKFQSSYFNRIVVRLSNKALYYPAIRSFKVDMHQILFEKLMGCYKVLNTKNVSISPNFFIGLKFILNRLTLNPSLSCITPTIQQIEFRTLRTVFVEPPF